MLNRQTQIREFLLIFIKNSFPITATTVLIFPLPT